MAIGNKRSLGIRMDSGAGIVLSKMAAELLNAYNIGAAREASERKVRLSAIDLNKISSELGRIQGDGVIYYYEAPVLFRYVEELAGPDRALSADEAVGIKASYDAYFTDVAVEIADAVILKSSSLLLGKTPEFDERVDLADRYVVNKAEGLFATASQCEWRALREGLSIAEEVLNPEIEHLEGYVKDLREKEYSFWNYVSAENMLGIPAWTSTYRHHFFGGQDETTFMRDRYDCKTFSSVELDGARQLLSKFYSVRTGLNILKAYAEGGVITDRGLYVQEFLQSPFADMADIKGLNGRAIPADTDDMAAMAEWLIEHAVQFGAHRYAYAYYNAYEDRFSESAGVRERIYPSRVLAHFDNHMTVFANAAVSLDSLLLYSAFSGVGMIVSAFKFALLPERYLRYGWMARLVTPGVPLLRFASRHKALSLLRAGGNFGYEIIKLQAFMIGGYYIGGHEGLDIGADLFIAGNGFVTGFLGGAGSRLMKELAVDRAGIVSRGLINAAGDTSGVVDALAAHAGGPLGLKSFRLASPMTAQGVSAGLSRIKRSLATEAGLAEKMARRAGNLLEDIRGTAGKNAGMLGADAENIVKEAERIAGANAPREAIPMLGARLADLRNRVMLAERAASRAQAADAAAGRSFGGGKKAGGGKGGGNTAASVKGAGRTVARETAVTKNLQHYTKKPPRKITAKIISDATGGKISVRNITNIEKTYKRLSPSARRSFWCGIRERLTGNRAGTWAETTPEYAAFDETVKSYSYDAGGHRLSVEEAGKGAFEIIGLE